MKRTNFEDASQDKIPNYNPFVILTNDPSMTGWGWVIVDAKKDKILEAGCIKTEPEHKKRRIRKSDDTTRRASEIVLQLLRVIRKHDVSYILTEAPHGSQNASAAIMIGLCAGLLQGITDTLGIGIEWYSEQDSKKSILHKRSATKQEMIDAIKEVYDVPWTGIKYRDEAIADALAVYYTACQLSSTLKLFKR